MKEITITSREAGQRLDKYLLRYLPSAGKGFLYKMMRKKNITRNKEKMTGQEMVGGRKERNFFGRETLCGCFFRRRL